MKSILVLAVLGVSLNAFSAETIKMSCNDVTGATIFSATLKIPTGLYKKNIAPIGIPLGDIKSDDFSAVSSDGLKTTQVTIAPRGIGAMDGAPNTPSEFELQAFFGNDTLPSAYLSIPKFLDVGPGSRDYLVYGHLPLNGQSNDLNGVFAASVSKYQGNAGKEYPVLCRVTN